MRRACAGLVAAAAVLVALTPAAHGRTHFVASNGIDGIFCAEGLNLCGSKTNPCRTITCAIANASAGDTIIVGPGRYGDLDSDGFPGEAGEELGSPGCSCMLSLNKAVKVYSSAGAAATVIDARSLSANTNVLIITDGGEFGKPGKGFTVTTSLAGNRGIVIDSVNVAVRGNVVVRDISKFGYSGAGISTVTASAGPVLIEGNLVNGWTEGILAAGAGTTVRKNQAALNATGIHALRSNAVVGNVVTTNVTGIWLEGSASAVGNAVHANATGIRSSSGGVVEKNNVFGNASCGLENFGVPDLPAANNFWGAATGPGPDPADRAGQGCDIGASTIVAPHATRPFKVKAVIKP